MRFLVTGFFVFFVSVLQAADPAPLYYWGFADSAHPDGQHTKTFVLGVRTLDEKKQVKSDTQLYASPEENEEYRYEFDFKNNQMKAFTTANNKPAGTGTFKCDGSVSKHTKCEYHYETTGKGSYKSDGKDVSGDPALAYREENTLTYNESNKTVSYSVDYYVIDKKFYTQLRSKLVRK